MLDVAHDTLSYDARLWRTLKPLMLSPGFLSREYTSGRRARYTAPFRLYLVISILAFLMVSFIVDTAKFGSGFVMQPDVPGETVESGTPPVFQFNDAAWDAEDNPVEVSWLGERGNAWLNRQIGKLIENSQEIRRNPARFVHTLIGMLPQMMFVLLPVFAFVITFFYLFAGRYYVEHLILQVHNHAFLFLALIALILLGNLRGQFADADFPTSAFWAGGLGALNIAIQLWIPLYILISLKRFYRQGWILTTLKFSALTLGYFILFVFALAITAVLGILNL